MSIPMRMLKELGTIHTGSTPKTNDDSLFGGDVPFVTPSDLGGVSPIQNTPRTLTDAGAKTSDLLPANSVLVCCIGSLGKIGFSGRTVVTNQQINAVVFNPAKVDARYGFFACRMLKPQLELMAPATTVPIVNKSRFSELKIPVPPLEEQRRIAAILDQAETLRTQRRAALAQLDSLTQALFLEMFGDPLANPKGWETQSLTDFFQFRTGKLDSNAATKDGEYPFFTCAKEDFRIDRYAFDCEALLLAGNNANADYSVKHYMGKFNAYQRTYVLTLSDVQNSYVYARVVLEMKLQELKRESKGSSTKYLTIGLMDRLRLQVPEKNLQQTFATRIQAIESLKTTHRTALTELDALFASLQQRAFAEEL